MTHKAVLAVHDQSLGVIYFVVSLYLHPLSTTLFPIRYQSDQSTTDEYKVQRNECKIVAGSASQEEEMV
jgi:hypothetical protein